MNFRLALWGLVLAVSLFTVTGVFAPVLAQDKLSATQELVSRIEQLEEQIVDMQVVIGTLQSLPRGGSRGAPVGDGGRTPGGLSVGGASDAARLDGMETQIRALSSQVAQLAQQMRNMNAGGGRRGAVDGNVYPQQPQLGQIPTGAGEQPTGAISGFGSTTVRSSDRPRAEAPAVAIDRRGGVLGNVLSKPAPGKPMASLGPAGEPNRDEPKKQYETAYGYLLQQQYGAAEAAFRDFLQAHPHDPLAGNAQYWLGESYYVQGQYKSAANAFLKGYETYAKGRKAPDSLLKLAMSLERLGQKDAAYSSLSELSRRFPRAPAHVKKRALSERKSAGC